MPKHYTFNEIWIHADMWSIWEEKNSWIVEPQQALFWIDSASPLKKEYAKKEIKSGKELEKEKKFFRKRKNLWARSFGPIPE